MDVDEPLKRIVNPNNIVDRIQSVDDRTLAGASASVESGNELFSQLDDQFGGRFISPTGESLSGEPTDEEFSGSVLSGNGVTPFDEAGTFNLAIINDGETTYGVGQSGTYSNGVDFFNRQLATGTSTDQRQLRSGFQELQGNDDPSYIFEFLDTAIGENLITNPDFETGDDTGWTLSAGCAVVPTSRIGWGSYCLELGNNPTDDVVSNKYSCLAGSTLSVNFETLYFSKTTVYIRFYNAVSTLLSSSIVFSKTNETFTGSVSSPVVVPIGATQFDIYIDRSKAQVVTLFDNFNVHVVSISNEFGFHGEDGQILMGNGKFKTNDLGAYIARGSLSGVTYATNTNTTISTSGQTTVFNGTIPANYFSKGQIRFKVMAFIDTNANNRTITPRLVVGATTLTGYVFTLAANLVWCMVFEGTISYNTTDVQELNLVTERVQNATGGTSYAKDISRKTAANDDASTISFSFTLQLSGSVDSGFFSSVIVESIMNTDVW